MNQPEPSRLGFDELRNDIERGLIKIPQFQRDFVWARDKSAKLLDSILKGYPIGTFILWKTRETLRSVKNIGGALLPDTPAGDYVHYVLDGQQRLTSIYASLRGLRVVRDGRAEDFAEMYADLTATGEQDIVSIDSAGMDPAARIKIVDLLNGDFSFLSSFPPQYHTRLSEYKRRLETYSFSAIFVKEAPIDVATEIFTRINVGGKALSVFEIMVAKTYDAGKGFDLGSEVERLQLTLADVDYDTLSPSVILQAVSIILVKECAKTHILRLPKADFIRVWPKALSAFIDAVEYFRNYYRVPVSNLLPFASLLVPFTYFFYRQPGRPTADQQLLLDEFFWRCGLGGRYSHSLETHLAQDVRRIDQILIGDIPEYDTGIDVSAEFIRRNGHFSTGRSYIKALLCLLTQQGPRSFADNSPVRVSNDWLKQANSKNYHHFFPRAFLRRNGVDDAMANHIANITIVDDYMNKREIRDQPPATYMRTFARRNPRLDQAMGTHLIDPNSFGVWENDYDLFFRKRSDALAALVRDKILLRDIDERGQIVIPDNEEAEDVALL
jgi:hypothetical protein